MIPLLVSFDLVPVADEEQNWFAHESTSTPAPIDF